MWGSSSPSTAVPIPLIFVVLVSSIRTIAEAILVEERGNIIVRNLEVIFAEVVMAMMVVMTMMAMGAMGTPMTITFRTIRVIVIYPFAFVVVRLMRKGVET